MSSRPTAVRTPTGIADWERAGGSAADQVRFDREWSALREYAGGRGIGLIGDVPIYVAQDSVDQLNHPELFLQGAVAGAPPDRLGPLGQHWGNPLFDWKALAEQGYRWWIERLRRTFALYDLARIDHFRGFAAFWAIPEGADDLDARTGHWLPGPGESVFRAAEAELGELPVIAEDLGVITKDVEVLRDALGFPGMVVLLWAFQGPAEQPAPAREPPRAPDRLHHDPRHGHAARTPAGQGAVDADRARPLVTSGRLHDPRPGRARPGQRGPHEHARRSGTATGRGGSSRAS